jgi:alkylation response protein AidB-like acyl-CoA dehydrogenase
MDFGLTDEQEQLAEAERAWLALHDPLARVRTALDAAPITIDAAAVAHTEESGLLDLLTPEMGGTHVDLAVLTEAHGHAASSLPIADLAVAAWLLSIAGMDDGGDRLIGLTVAEDDAGTPVPMAADLDAIAVVRQDGANEYLSVLTTPTLVTMSTLDLTRSWARIDLDAIGTAATELPAGTLAAARDALAVHRAFDALGAASRLLDMTVEYAGQREQFGAPIGSFQAVKHHCADMVVAVEAGRAALWAGALALDTVIGADRSRAASAAAAYAKSAAARVAGNALQVHGGIGFTWEHDLHLLLRRIKVDEAFNGAVADHRAALVSG